MIAIGFKGERVAVLPRSFVSLMEDNPLTGDLYITSMGYVSNAAYPYRASSNGEEEYFFIYCTIGNGRVESGDYSFELRTNQYIVVSASRSYVIKADVASPWTIYWVTFRGEKAKIYASMMDSVATIVPSTYSRNEQRIELFETMFTLMNGELSIDKLNYANLLLATFFASFVYEDVFNESIPKSESRVRTMVNQVTHFMSENLDKKLTLSQLSDYAGYSPSYFYRNFVKEMDESPIEYFIRMKINKASIYLIKSSMTVAQIAAKLGFDNPDYFSRTFKKVVGLSASEFRRQRFRL